jgi:hypothetical protein
LRACAGQAPDLEATPSSLGYSGAFPRGEKGVSRPSVRRTVTSPRWPGVWCLSQRRRVRGQLVTSLLGALLHRGTHAKADAWPAVLRRHELPASRSLGTRGELPRSRAWHANAGTTRNALSGIPPIECVTELAFYALWSVCYWTPFALVRVWM